MKEKLRLDLLDDRIVSLVGYDIDSEPKVYFLYAPESIIGDYIEYEIYDEDEVFYDENTEKAITYYIQVDVFTSSDYSEIVETIRRVLKEKGYDGGRGPDLYENSTKLYHKPLRFTYTEILE